MLRLQNLSELTPPGQQQFLDAKLQRRTAWQTKEKIIRRKRLITPILMRAFIVTEETFLSSIKFILYRALVGHLPVKNIYFFSKTDPFRIVCSSHYFLKKKYQKKFLSLKFPKLKMFKQYLCGDWPQASSFSNTSVVNNRNAF